MSDNPDHLLEIEKEIIGDIWTSTTCYDNLVALCEIAEHRFTGTGGEQRARDLLLDLVTKYGLINVHAEPYEFESWQRNSAHLEMLYPIHREFDCLALGGSPSCVVEGELEDLGQGTLGDFEASADRIPGRIVMMTSKRPAYAGRNLRQSVKCLRAIQAGASGIIWVRNEGGGLIETGTLGWRGTPPIPGVSVSREVGHGLARAARDKTGRVRISMQNSLERTTGWNVIGELSGDHASPQLIVAGAHYDSEDNTVGAMDNAAGTIVMLEAARALAKHVHSIGKTIRFVCFSGEEVGLVGSQQYVKQHEWELDNIAFMLNLDGPGRPSDSGVALQGWGELIKPLRRIARDMRDPVLIDNYVIPYCDAFPFMTAGIPSATLFPIADMPERGWNHTPADTLDKISIRDLRRDAVLTARLLLRISNAKEWSAPHKSLSEVQSLLATAGFHEVLELEGRWSGSALE